MGMGSNKAAPKISGYMCDALVIARALEDTESKLNQIRRQGICSLVFCRWLMVSHVSHLLRLSRHEVAEMAEMDRLEMVTSIHSG